MKKRLARLYRRAQRAIRPHIISPGQHARTGDVARDRGDWAAARGHYIKAVAADPSLAAIWVQLGHAHKLASDLDAAESAYRRSLALEPSNDDTWMQLGHVLKLMGRRDEAGESYQAAADLSPDNTYAVREAADLAGRLQGVPRPTKAARSSNFPIYESRALGTGRVLLDITAALEFGSKLAFVIRQAVVSQSTQPIDVLRWQAGEGWLDDEGRPFRFGDNYAALIVTGPFQHTQTLHIEAIRHIVLHGGVPLVGAMFDLTPMLEPRLYSREATEAASAFVAVMTEYGSGILAMAELDVEEARGVVRSFTHQIERVAAETDDPPAAVRADAPILLIGHSQSQEMMLAEAALGLMSQDEAIGFQSCASESLPFEKIDASGAVLLSADVGTRLIGAQLLGAGIPIAIGARRGLSRFADRSESFASLISAPEAASSLLAFSRVCRDADRTKRNAPDAPTTFSLSTWRIRRINLDNHASRLSQFGVKWSATLERGGPFSVCAEGSVPRDESGVILGSQALVLGVATGQTLGVAAFLVTSRERDATVMIAPQKGGSPISQRVMRGSSAWIRLRLEDSAVRHSISISADSEEQDASIHLAAAYLYPASKPGLWGEFIDRVARGQHSYIKETTRETINRNAFQPSSDAFQ